MSSELTDKAIDFWLELTTKRPKTYWVHCDSCDKWRCLPDSQVSKTDRWVCENMPGLKCDVGQVFPARIIDHITGY